MNKLLEWLTDWKAWVAVIIWFGGPAAFLTYWVQTGDRMAGFGGIMLLAMVLFTISDMRADYKINQALEDKHKKGGEQE